MSERTNHADNAVRIVELNFQGPFTFHRSDHYLFSSECVSCEGVYVWTIRNELDDANYVHYIGETTSFGRRHREHLLQITGLNYRILDADHASRGIEQVIWNGMWRDRSPQAPANLIESYDDVSKSVTDYIRCIRVFFARTLLERDERMQIEACLAKTVRAQGLEANRYYPADNRVRALSGPHKFRLAIKTAEEIIGLS